MITCVIIDDEQHCIDTLAAMLKVKFGGSVTLLASTTDSRKAATLIAQYKPQVVFMDVEMPHITGIQLMHSFVQRRFAVIFTTAYEKYALQALKTEVVDYLLKPISLTELGEALEKASQRLLQMEVIIAKNAGAGTGLQKLLLPTASGVLAANIADIIRVESSSNYCYIHISGKPKILVARTLKEYENILTPCKFFRVHKSHLVNLCHVEYLRTGPDEYVILTNGEHIDVSRRRKADLMQQLSAL